MKTKIVLLGGVLLVGMVSEAKPGWISSSGLPASRSARGKHFILS